jgi:RNA polymerase sigma factor (sigma-70 family)
MQKITEENVLTVYARYLSPTQLLYIKMFYLNGFTMREISRQLGVNPSTVSRGIKRGIKTLQQKGVVIYE